MGLLFPNTELQLKWIIIEFFLLFFFKFRCYDSSYLKKKKLQILGIFVPFWRRRGLKKEEEKTCRKEPNSSSFAYCISQEKAGAHKKYYRRIWVGVLFLFGLERNKILNGSKLPFLDPFLTWLHRKFLHLIISILTIINWHIMI